MVEDCAEPKSHRNRTSSVKKNFDKMLSSGGGLSKTFQFLVTDNKWAYWLVAFVTSGTFSAEDADVRFCCLHEELTQHSCLRSNGYKDN